MTQEPLNRPAQTPTPHNQVDGVTNDTPPIAIHTYTPPTTTARPAKQITPDQLALARKVSLIMAFVALLIPVVGYYIHIAFLAGIGVCFFALIAGIQVKSIVSMFLSCVALVLNVAFVIFAIIHHG